MWNPDWSYAFPQSGYADMTNVGDYGRNDAAYYDSNSDYPFFDDGTEGEGSFLDEFAIKDGGPIPLLSMTYINKTIPKPCDKEVDLYELNDEKLYNPDKQTGKPRPVKGTLSNCHESNCERYGLMIII